MASSLARARHLAEIASIGQTRERGGGTHLVGVAHGHRAQDRGRLGPHTGVLVSLDDPP